MGHINDGPLHDLADVLTGSAGDRGDNDILDRIRRDEAIEEAKEAADRAAETGVDPTDRDKPVEHDTHATSVNEPSPSTTMRDFAEEAAASGVLPEPRPGQAGWVENNQAKQDDDL